MELRGPGESVFRRRRKPALDERRTQAGTTLVKDVGGEGGSGVGRLATVGATVMFASNDLNFGNELWKSDGTAAGTVMVKDIFTGLGGGIINIVGINGRALVTVTRTNDTGRDPPPPTWELWGSDGTSAGTALLQIAPPATIRPAEPITR